MLGGEPMLRARLLRDRTIGLRLPDGKLIAAAGIGHREATAATSGMVHPMMRHQGIGGRLLRWALEQAGDAALLVETESCSDDAEALYARHGLIRTFAESVMRHDLVDVPKVALPHGVRVISVSSAREDDLFDVYRASFADRPGFVEPDGEEWLSELRNDPQWRRDLSMLVRDERARPIGFVNVLGHWLDQVGVLPGWRGRGLGAFLVASCLQRLAVEGSAQMWLCVNADNPAENLYRRMGFTRYGTRARYLRPGKPAAAPSIALVRR